MTSKWETLEEVSLRLLPKGSSLASWQLELIDILKSSVREMRLGENTENPSQRKIVLSAPPQHGKSTIVSEAFPFWLLTNGSKKHDGTRVNVAIVSHNMSLAKKRTKKIRDMLKRKLINGTSLLDMCDRSVQSCSTIYGATLRAFSPGSSITGHAIDVMILDDIQPNDVSVGEMNKLIEWFDEEVMTRMSEKGVIVNLQTRWSTDDIYNYLSNKPGFITKNWPAIDQCGKALGPKSLNFLKEQRAANEVMFQRLYMGNPASVSAVSLFKRPFNSARPMKHSAAKRLIVTVDPTAGGGSAGDWCVAHCWAFENTRDKNDEQGRMTLLAAQQQKWEHGECDKFKDWLSSFLSSCLSNWTNGRQHDILLYVENSAWGTALPQRLSIGFSQIDFATRIFSRAEKSIAVNRLVASKSKSARVRDVRLDYFVNEGDVWINKNGPFPIDPTTVSEIERQFSKFKDGGTLKGEHDDHVDAAQMAFAIASDKGWI